MMVVCIIEQFNYDFLHTSVQVNDCINNDLSLGIVAILQNIMHTSDYIHVRSLFCHKMIDYNVDNTLQ